MKLKLTSAFLLCSLLTYLDLYQRKFNSCCGWKEAKRQQNQNLTGREELFTEVCSSQPNKNYSKVKCGDIKLWVKLVTHQSVFVQSKI